MSTSSPDLNALQDLQRDLGEAIVKMDLPGAAMAVWHQGNLAQAAAGSANVEADIAVDDRTLFQIGSITKVFTATLVMQLVEQGLLDLDSPVSAYLPALRIAGELVPDAMTLRTLLDYSAGMDGDFFANFGPDPSALERYVDACADLTYVHSPGQMRSYNSTSYCIAGRVIEVATGQPFDIALATRLLAPLGMKRFAFYTHDVARFRTAVGHRRREAQGGFDVVEVLRLPHCMSAAGASLTTTARDLLRFGLLHLQGGMTEDGKMLLSRAGVEAMRTPFRVVPPSKSELMLGWATLPTTLGPLVVASGRTIEQNSFLFFLPSLDFCASILSNTGDGGQRLFLDLGVKLLERCTGARVEFPAPPSVSISAASEIGDEEAEIYVGRYGAGYRLEVFRANGRLASTLSMMDSASGQLAVQRFDLVRVEGDRFAAIADGATEATSVVDFIRPQHSSGPASHAASAGRLFARQDQSHR